MNNTDKRKKTKYYNSDINTETCLRCYKNVRMLKLISNDRFCRLRRWRHCRITVEVTVTVIVFRALDIVITCRVPITFCYFCP